MSRILFAAGRGARIQVMYLSKWIPLTHLSLVPNSYAYRRIHPDDAHLAYGPVSTALREMAINDLWKSKCWEWILASSAAGEFNDCYDRYRRENEDYPLFYLFLAEFLADEGM
jgi:hypothetical protein